MPLARRIPIVVAAGALLGCGVPGGGARSACAAVPAPDVQAEAGRGEEAAVEAGAVEPEAPPFVYTVADCVSNQIWTKADGSMAVATSLDEFVALAGCEPSGAIDWSSEHVAMVNFMAIGAMVYFQGVSMEGELAVIRVTQATLVGGAGVASKAQLFVRIPASASAAKLVTEAATQEWKGPPQNPALQ